MKHSPIICSLNLMAFLLSRFISLVNFIAKVSEAGNCLVSFPSCTSRYRFLQKPYSHSFGLQFQGSTVAPLGPSSIRNRFGGHVWTSGASWYFHCTR